MTNTTTAQSVSDAAVSIEIEGVLSQHGYASSDDAREDNVAFGCFGCGSIASVTPTATSTREQQRDLIDWDCCSDTFEI